MANKYAKYIYSNFMQNIQEQVKQTQHFWITKWNIYFSKNIEAEHNLQYVPSLLPQSV